MRKVWSIMLFVVMMVGMATNVAASGFTDVRDTWYETEVNALASKGVIAGTSATTFSPGQDVTRGQFAAFVARALDLPFGGRNNFNDIDATNPFYIELNELGQAGIMTGDQQGNSNWNSPITRVEATAIIDRMLQVEGIKTDSYKKPLFFRDNHAIPAWANESVGNMVGLEIVAGMPDGSFSGNVKVSRATAAVLLYRAFEVIDSGEGNTEDSVGGVRYLGPSVQHGTVHMDFFARKLVSGDWKESVYNTGALVYVPEVGYDHVSGRFDLSSDEANTLVFENWIGFDYGADKQLRVELYLYKREDLFSGCGEGDCFVYDGVLTSPYATVNLNAQDRVEFDVSEEEFDLVDFRVVLTSNRNILDGIRDVNMRFSFKD
ncbi:S-layer homology domain-containing protein [Paenalkalicoccus suaedae]|uniref:S-layer homology domain-containing protein n=1 Tax=Paenalkalicoccus suaedae TaxID=2592382 RepID=A0A859FGU7_9BACI|nr:S-layer homology domain-containing protein [Paenalkalicoccus suaedae]QKS72593.1 S-layer homology domain-containing protein [Paenalkalicoccus suaedae]